MRFNLTARRICLAPALGLVLVTAASACSSSGLSSSPQGAQGSFTAAASPTHPSGPPVPAASSGGASASGGSASAVAAITANWNTFFNSSTPNSKRVQLLENGSQFSSAISAFTSSPLASAVTSKVDSVTVSSATKAAVKYDLSALGSTVAKGASGTAVLQNGTWKVGDGVFCGLLKQGAPVLGIKVPAACSTAG